MPNNFERLGATGRNDAPDLRQQSSAIAPRNVRAGRDAQALHDRPQPEDISAGPQDVIPTGAGPRTPLRPAPARMGAAGISAGQSSAFKTTVDLDARDPRVGSPEDRLGQALGWLSIGLGLFELINAEGLARWLGMPHRAGVVRAFGLREVGTGIGILAHRSSVQRAPWLWARVGGDAIDLYALHSAKRHGARRNANMAIAGVLGVTALDVMAAGLLSEK